MIRLKDSSWQSLKDYGRRLDYVCASTETLFQCQALKPREFWAYPKRGEWNRASVERFRAQTLIPVVVWKEVRDRWVEVFKTMSDTPNPSLGVAAILFAAERGFQDIRLVGFDNLLEPARFDYRKAGKGKVVTRHDWVAEHALLPKIVNEYGVRLWDGVTTSSPLAW